MILRKLPCDQLFCNLVLSGRQTLLDFTQKHHFDEENTADLRRSETGFRTKKGTGLKKKRFRASPIIRKHYSDTVSKSNLRFSGVAETKERGGGRDEGGGFLSRQTDKKM